MEKIKNEQEKTTKQLTDLTIQLKKELTSFKSKAPQKPISNTVFFNHYTNNSNDENMVSEVFDLSEITRTDTQGIKKLLNKENGWSVSGEFINSVRRWEEGGRCEIWVRINGGSDDGTWVIMNKLRGRREVLKVDETGNIKRLNWLEAWQFDRLGMEYMGYIRALEFIKPNRLVNSTSSGMK